MKKVILLFLFAALTNICFGSWIQRGTKFHSFDGVSKVISCNYEMSGDVVVRNIEVYFDIYDFRNDSINRIYYLSWSLEEDSINVKTEANIPIGGCFQNGLFTFYDRYDSIYTVDLNKRLVIWHGHSDLSIADIAITDSLVYIAKKNGELVISNNFNGDNVKRVTDFAPSIDNLIISPIHNLLCLVSNNGIACIYNLESLSLIDSIKNAKIINIHNHNEILFATRKDSLYLYDLSNKKLHAFDFDKPDGTSINSIISCGKYHFAFELTGAASIIKLVNKYSSVIEKDILVPKDRYENYKGVSLLGFSGDAILTVSGCKKYFEYYFKDIPCHYDLTEIISLPQDTIAPEIIINLPENSLGKQETTDDFLFIKGRVVDSTEVKSVTINKTDAPFLPKTGEFNGYIKLELGDNIINIEATDIYNNKSQSKINILKTANTNRATNSLIYKDDYNQLKEYTYHALMIAEQDYVDENIKDLSYPILDVTNFKNILVQYYAFDENTIKLLVNPTRNEIIKSLDSLLGSLKSKDHLLVFFAGHGVFDTKLKSGYWLPSDAKLDNKGTWVSNNDIRDYIAGIDTKHTLLIADACFSGSILDYTRDVDIEPEKIITTMLKKKSRTAMTSGLDEVVPDKSVFIDNLLKYLIENPKKYVTANQLFNELNEAVISNTNNLPQYGVIKNSNHEGGEFIFLRKE